MNWISAKDTVPENNSRVVILLLGDINSYGYPYCYEDAVEVGFYENGKWFSDTRFDTSFGWQDMNVTHWMPLPEKPNRGGEITDANKKVSE